MKEHHADIALKTSFFTNGLKTTSSAFQPVRDINLRALRQKNSATYLQQETFTSNIFETLELPS